MVHTDAIRRLEPTLIPLADGAWLAVAGPAAPVRVGAPGLTPEAACLGFTEAINLVAGALDRGDEGGEAEAH
jgi:hypothetical protein